jgi:putative phage-type endonuclease
MPIVEGLEQQSADWLKMRVGMVTGSRAADVMSFLSRKSKNGEKGDESAARRDYRYEIAIECLTGLSATHFQTDAMKWGIENEPLARAAYEMANDIETESIGFAIHDRISRFGASPDSLVGTDGLLEIKCPQTMTHIDYMLNGVIPTEYEPQMLAEMACTGRQWVDFLSFDPRLPKRLQRFQKRFMRDDPRIAEMEQAVEKFLSEVDDLLLRLRQDDPSSLVPQLVKSLEAV